MKFTKFADMNPCFAILDRNTLSSSKLKELLIKIFPAMEVLSYDSVGDFIKDSNRHFIHFFVSDFLLLNHIEEFEPLKSNTTVLTSSCNFITRSGYHTLNTSNSERDIVSSLKDLRENFRNGACYPDYISHDDSQEESLSRREREVLRLIVKGLTSKEIAETIGISLPTATFHRNNICSKLGTRSLGKLTVQAILLGLIDIEDINNDK